MAPADEIAAREKQQLESRNQVADLAPLYTEYLQINYAKASEVAALLSSESTKLLSSESTKLLSPPRAPSCSPPRAPSCSLPEAQ